MISQPWRAHQQQSLFFPLLSPFAINKHLTLIYVIDSDRVVGCSSKRQTSESLSLAAITHSSSTLADHSNSSPATTMQIPKQISSPADPKEPSFLNLPAEIRNQIYELLFTREEPVLLHNAKAYHAIPPQRIPDSSWPVTVEAFDEAYENEICQGQIFVHDFQTVTPALLLCRQVYAEAAGYLYGNNTFMFSRPLYCHDSRGYDEEDAEYDDDSYFVTNYVAQWLQNLGSQLKFLKEVRIDAGALCPERCYRALGDVSILKLVRLLWEHPYLADVVAFTQREPTEREKDDCSEYNHFEEEDDMDRAGHLQRILIAISTQDVLDLKRYAFKGLLVDNIVLYSSLMYGGVTGPNLIRHFSALEQEAVKWVEFGSSRDYLGRLPTLLQSKILRLVTFSADQIVLDLDSRSIRGLNPIGFHLSRKLRDAVTFNSIPYDTSIVVRKSISTTTSDSKNFAVVASELVSPTGRNSGYSIFWGSFQEIFSSHPSIVIVLDFDIATATSLKEIRINIKEVVPILSHISSYSKAKAHFVLKCPWGNSIHHEEVTISVVELIQSLFLLLSDVRQQWPSEMAKAGGSQLPDIWLNGNGVLIFASYPASSHSSERRVEYAHGRLTPTEIRNRGYRMAMATYTTYNHGTSVGMLYKCWIQIRGLHYQDRDRNRV